MGMMDYAWWMLGYDTQTELENKNAIIIQKYCRGYLARQEVIKEQDKDDKQFFNDERDRIKNQSYQIVFKKKKRKRRNRNRTNSN
jgi:hypothetical protein